MTFHAFRFVAIKYNN